MITRSEDLKSCCQKILAAVDSNEISLITETLEIVVEGNILFINVTNKEYYAQVKFDLHENCLPMRATVNANIFLKLVSQITTDTIGLEVSDKSLIVTGNGVYKLPLIFEEDHLLELPRIEINNITSNFTIDSSILNSILTYNSKELTKGTISRPVQKFYYVDSKGAITFTSGACVNSFVLPQDIKILLNNRLVKLFKLFKEGPVNFYLGHDAISNDIIQTKVRFENDDIQLTAILSCDDSMLNSVPESAIRNRANNTYPFSVNISKEALIQSINRLLLFSSGIGEGKILKPYSEFHFDRDHVTINDAKKENSEDIRYNNADRNINEPYVAILDLVDLKTTLETCVEQYLTINFGDHVAVVLSRGNIKNVIPEIKEM